MPDDRFEVGIIVAKRALKSRWASHAWLPVAALPAIPVTEPWTVLSATPEEKTYYAGAYEVSLHPAETSHYRDNLISGRPSLWVALRQIAEGSYEVANVTADPYEGESMAEGIGEVVEAVPMPEEVQAKVLAFFDAFHVEQVFHKRKRDRADPEALARQGTGTRRRGDEG
ncbi:DUF3305 domain-containing protein [Methylobacterium sp. 10]|uniref:DUF3305 domain-containing protein n=1 Tax=Methylobacterium sp. 10 TaxID=1101191 RepID=UPI000559C7A5|nr:DUF3305 domain-containing protein [Methylobacterium sp. 10]